MLVGEQQQAPARLRTASVEPVSSAKNENNPHDESSVRREPFANDADVAKSWRRRPGRPTSHTPVGEIETRALILHQARRLFILRGFADVSVGEVAEAVGVTKPTLYYHFQSKQGLYTEALCDIMREVGGFLREIVRRELPLRDRLREVAMGFFLHANTAMEPMLRDTHELIGHERAKIVLAVYQREMIDPVAELLREGIRSHELRAGDAKMLVRAFFGLLDAFTAPDSRSGRSIEAHDQAAEALVSLFLDGAGA